jgi:hypothetical protein
MNKKDLATKIFNDLVDDYLINDDMAINKKDEIIESIQGRLSTYLIIEGGNILLDTKGKARI